MKIFVSLLIASLVLTGCAKKDANALPNDGIVKECSDIKVNKQITSGIALDCLGSGQQSLIQESLRGPMVVNVFGSWCWPCRQEIPYFRSFYEHHQKEIQLIGIAVEEAQKSDTTDFIEGMGIKWPSLYDPDGRTRLNIGMGVPVTIFIDKHGNVTGKLVGAVKSEAEIANGVKKYLGLNLQ